MKDKNLPDIVSGRITVIKVRMEYELCVTNKVCKS